MADKRKKGGYTVNSVESRDMSEKGETMGIRLIEMDWFEHSETESPLRFPCAPKLMTF